MSASIRVQLLGPVRAFDESGPVTLRGKTARTVLARLALSPGTVVSVDQLTDALWADDPPLEPTTSIRSTISRLRTQLGRNTIVTAGTGYRLDPALVEIDLDHIDRVVKRNELPDADPDTLAEQLDRWIGEPLTDVAWTPVFEPERTRIDELRARLVDCYHESMLRSGRAAESLADLEREAAGAPLRESTQLLLMRTLDACGRTADALRAGNTYRRRLVDRTGLDPSAEYDEVARSLLSTEAPSAESHAASNAVETSRPVSRATWIPPDTPFVGRQSELADLGRLVGERRLVTITGPGGVGKTRLVTELMSSAGGRWDAQVCMVGLAALERGAAVDTAVAGALGLEVSSADSVQALVDRLASQTSILVLDNCEHVLAGTRTLVESLLREVSTLSIVITSRRRLGMAEEVIIEVGPLDLPFEHTVDSAPVRLFLDRVERAAPELSVSDVDIAASADICRLLDGLPLALELAAPRVAMFGFNGVRRRLLEGLALASAEAPDDDRRQATIESTVEWSLALLSPAARSLFDELSVFPSWFDLDALAQVSESGDVVGGLSEILDSSLVVIDHSRPAYRLLEPIRQVAHRQIGDERRAQITARYLTWVASIIDTIDDLWIIDDRRAAQDLVADRRDDLRWSLRHYIEHDDADAHGHFANVLARVLVDRADNELIELCSVDVAPSLEGDLARCMLAWHGGDPDTAGRVADSIGALIEPSSDYWGYYHWVRTPIYLYLGDVDRLIDSASLAVNDERTYPSLRSESVSLWALGLLYSGRRQEAAAVLDDHADVLRHSDSGGFVAYARAEIVAERDPDLALRYLAEASTQAAAARATFTQRLTDISQLVLLIASHHADDAARLALRLIPELLRAGTSPQAWTAMRHIADLLGQLDAPDVGLLVLDSAAAAPSAPAVVGDAVLAEEQLRATLRARVEQIGTPAAPGAPVALMALWERVETILRAHA